MELTWVDPSGLCSELIPELIFKTMVDAKLVGEALTEWRGFDRMVNQK